MITGLTPELLVENRGWMQPTALDPAGMLRFCFQSYIVGNRHEAPT
ncbi:hypothetical protein GA0061098_10893 [Bradyrhizobium shewense]|uniref:Uncharacterized protein n=1 Tax=Bradyrhizobium shewense TaxID=1761772 RepID=A0A1C3XV29_9BRAD|nr:hypothetical protein [Bradyrhizobium shewense]SCB56147.1 hypothetical protein GA0061098_10893 [Bradyrhizobium shewense]